MFGLAAGVLLVPFVSRMAAAQQASGPMVPIERLDAALLAAMRAGKSTPFVQRYRMLEPVVTQVFDLQTLLAESVGFTWFSLSPQQKAQLLDVFRRYTVSTYAANFDSYNGQSFRMSPTVRTLRDGRVIVATVFVPRDDSPTALNYVMKQTFAGWQIVDVLADGSISRVATQRSDFASLLASGGAPALIAGLQRKIVSLSDGMMA
ncbi:MAG: ABC transporter substrate-binding protein [Acetobacteraceae bacterium]|nr:ABC transporter substrate-binding protein [Acetobacteraceae bacterium]